MYLRAEIQFCTLLLVCISDVMLCVVCSVRYSCTSPLFFTALPTFPFFFYPHDLVFNMDAEKPPHTLLFMLQPNKPIHLPQRTAVCNPQCPFAIVFNWSLNINFSNNDTAHFQSTIRKSTRNGVRKEPGKMNSSNTEPRIDQSEWELGSCQPISVSGLVETRRVLRVQRLLSIELDTALEAGPRSFLW